MVREAAQKGGIEYLDAWHLTHAHWWASWDGMHYSQVSTFMSSCHFWNHILFGSLNCMLTRWNRFLCARDWPWMCHFQRMSNLIKDSNIRAKEPRWMGGASMMSTQVLINAICNSCSWTTIAESTKVLCAITYIKISQIKTVSNAGELDSFTTILLCCVSLELS